MTHFGLGSPPANNGGVHKSHGHSTRDRRNRPSGSSSPFDSFTSPPSYTHASYFPSSQSLFDQSFGTIGSREEDSDDIVSTPDDSTRNWEASDFPDQSEVFIVEPVNKIHKANRRSSSLSECMMKEKMSYKPMGRDKDGVLSYALYLEESQGFRWNKNFQKFNNRVFGTDNDRMLQYEGLYDVFSDDDDYDDEVDCDRLSLQNNETAIIVD